MRRPSPLLVAALLAIAIAAWWGADSARRAYYTTDDEVMHVQASRELRSGPGVVSNFEHPVLMKVLAAAGLAIRPADRFVDEVRAARRAFPVVLGLLALVAGLWASSRAGNAAGLAVASLVAIEPTLRGHASLVHTDVLLTFFLAAAAALLDASGPTRSPRRILLVLSGVAYGLALVSKYSALPLLPVFVAACAIRLRGFPSPPTPDPRGERRRKADSSRLPVPSWGTAFGRAVAFVALPAVLTALLVQQAVVAATTSRASLVRGVETQFRGYPYRQEALRAAAGLPRGLSTYAAGLLWVRASAGAGARANYFLGEVSGTGWLLYFPVALALKLTTASVASLLAAVIAAIALFLRRAASGRRRRLRVLAARGLLPLGLGVAYLGAAMLSNVNIGVRHVLPCVPLVLVAAAGLLRTIAKPRVRVGVVSAVVLLAGLEAAAFHGREIPYGNVLAGGPPGLRRFLSDSNVDWGENLGRVFERASAGDLGRVGLLSQFTDEQGAGPAGVRWIESFGPGDLDTLFVSVFLWDLGHALSHSGETFPGLVETRDALVPLIQWIEENAASIEPFRDEYLLVQLRPRRPGPRTTSPSVPAAPARP